MPTFSAAKCPNCAGDLQLPNDRASVKCMYCGGDVIVQQAIKASAGGNVENWLKLAEAAEEAGNYDEVLTYVNKVLEVDPENNQAWCLKGIASGWLSNLLECRLGEMVSNMRHAIECTPEAELEKVRIVSALAINDAAAAYYDLISKHLLEFVTVDGAWQEFLNHAMDVLVAYEAAHEIIPINKVILQNIIQVCTELIQGIAYHDTDYQGRPTRRVHQLRASDSTRLTGLKAEREEELKALNPSYQPKEIKKAKVGVAHTILSIMRLFGATKY